MVGKVSFGLHANNLDELGYFEDESMQEQISELEDDIDLSIGEINIEHDELLPLGTHMERNLYSIQELITNRDSFNWWCTSRVLGLYQ